MISPLLILLIGVVIVLSLIVVFRLHAFIALISAAIIVSLLAPGPATEKIGRVAMAFGATAGNIGILIAAAAIIGRCLIDSGAADRIVRSILGLFGEKRSQVALMSSGYVLSIPVFFDTVFYLLLPLARSMHRQTGRNYLLLILAMGAGATISHSLVPPTPGPLLIADAFQIDIGFMILVGGALAAITAATMLPFIGWLSRRFDIPMRETLDSPSSEEAARFDAPVPGLLAAAAPIVLPVLLISTNTIMSTIAGSDASASGSGSLRGVMAVAGNPNLAMILAAACAMLVLRRQRREFDMRAMAVLIERSLASAGIIILITAAGGAFGAMLQAANVSQAITQLVGVGPGESLAGLPLLFVGFLVAFLIKFAQGSTTVAMITSSAMLASLVTGSQDIGFHPVYLACAVGFGAQCCNWMNDSGFWIFSKMSGLTEIETLKTWTVTVSTLAVVGFIYTILASQILPL